MQKLEKIVCRICVKESYESDQIKEVLVNGIPMLEIVLKILKIADYIEIKKSSQKLCLRCLMMLTEAQFNLENLKDFQVSCVKILDKSTQYENDNKMIFDDVDEGFKSEQNVSSDLIPQFDTQKDQSFLNINDNEFDDSNDDEDYEMDILLKKSAEISISCNSKINESHQSLKSKKIKEEKLDQGEKNLRSKHSITYDKIIKEILNLNYSSEDESMDKTENSLKHKTPNKISSSATKNPNSIKSGISFPKYDEQEIEKMLQKAHIVTKYQRGRCPICNENFKFLKNHILIHMKNRPKIKCDLCPKEYFNMRDLKIHEKNHHSEPKENEMEIEQEVPEVSSSTNIPELTRVNHVNLINQKYIYCNKCSEEFIHKDDLRNHLQLIHNLNTFKCNDCSYETIYKKHLQQHSLTHLKNILKSKTKQASDKPSDSKNANPKLENMHYDNELKTHIRNDKTCHICFKKFLRNNTLRSHIDTVHLKTPRYSCSLCPHSVPRRDYLKTHMNTCHPGADWSQSFDSTSVEHWSEQSF